LVNIKSLICATVPIIFGSDEGGKREKKEESTKITTTNIKEDNAYPFFPYS
jgi:hypothetical protein